MKKLLLILTVSLALISCSKENAEEQVDVAEVTGTYKGDGQLWGPVSCIQIEGGQRISISSLGRRRIWINYMQNGSFPAFVPFPNVAANLIAVKDGTYYFSVDNFDDGRCRVSPRDTRRHNNTDYNIAIFPDGRIDARMSYFSYTHTQGSQYFDFAGTRE